MSAGTDRTVRIFDTTLRDGEQSPGVALRPDEKLEIAEALAALGVDVIEAGFPVTSAGEFEAVRAIAARVRGPAVAALARSEPRDIDLAWEAIRGAERPRIHVFVSTSDVHLRSMLRIDRARCLELTRESVRYARRLCPEVEFSAQDATRTDWDFLCAVVREAIAAGATVVNLPDTVGYALPGEYAAMFRYVREQVPECEGVTLSAHTHDDLGLAVANALAAVEAGAAQVECTVNGIGERAGNCALEEVVMALRVRQAWFACRTGVDTRHLYPVSRLVAERTGIPVPPNKAVVGDNAFAHESGIHQDGVLKDRATYEIMDPAEVGVPASRLVLGKHSGRHALRVHLERLGYRLDATQLAEVFRRFKALVERNKGAGDDDLRRVAEEVLAESAAETATGTAARSARAG